MSAPVIVVAGALTGTTQELAAALGAGAYPATFGDWVGELVAPTDTFAHFVPLFA
jgi:hypothetical protein